MLDQESTTDGNEALSWRATRRVVTLEPPTDAERQLSSPSSIAHQQYSKRLSDWMESGERMKEK